MLDTDSPQNFHLGEQKAAKIAQGSSDSVKTISILALLFLPGTGIAVCQNSRSPLLSNVKLLLMKVDNIQHSFFPPSDSNFKVKIAPSFIFYCFWATPITTLSMIFWL